MPNQILLYTFAVKVCRVELTRVCIFKHSYHALFLKNSSTENIVFVIVKKKIDRIFPLSVNFAVKPLS